MNAFWTWFRAHEADLRAEALSPSLLTELERELFSIATVGWEIGPTGDGKWRLSLSPDPEDAVCVAALRDLVAGAPRLERWEIGLYKPPRAWELVFSVALPDGLREIDGTRWELVLYAFKDGSFDVLVKPDDTYGDLDDRTLRAAAEVIVIGELGEQLVLELIGEIEVVKDWQPEQAASARRFEVGLLRDLILRRKQPETLKKLIEE